MKTTGETTQRCISLISQLLADACVSECADVRSNDVSERISLQKVNHLDDMLDYLVEDNLVSDQAFSQVFSRSRFMYKSSGFIEKAGDNNAFLTCNPQTEGCTCSSECVSFDSLFASGCLNCGTPFCFFLDLLEQADKSAKTVLAQCHSSDSTRKFEFCLRCSACGHISSPLHFGCESDSLTDATHARKRIEWTLRQKNTESDSCTSISKSMKSEKGEESCIFLNTLNHGFVPDGIYLYGIRKGVISDGGATRWWKDRFFGSRFNDQKLNRRMRILESVSGRAKRGVVCHEICEKCGNDACLFSTFQARSADEGMTIMYECTKCQHRKVVNA